MAAALLILPVCVESAEDGSYKLRGARAALNDDSEVVVALALRELTLLRDSSSLPTIWRMVNSDSRPLPRAVATAAFAALSEQAGTYSDAVLELLKDASFPNRDILIRFFARAPYSAQATAYLRQLCASDRDDQIPRHRNDLLAKYRDRPALGWLENGEWLAERSQGRAALETLGHLAALHPGGAATVTELLQGADAVLGVDMMVFLPPESISVPAVLAAVLSFLERTDRPTGADGQILEKVAGVPEKVRARYQPQLILAARTRHINERRRIIPLLAADQSHVPTLISFVREDTDADVRAAAARKLGDVEHITSEIIEILATEVGSIHAGRQLTVNRSAAEALMAMGRRDRRAFDALADVLVRVPATYDIILSAFGAAPVRSDRLLRTVVTFLRELRSGSTLSWTAKPAAIGAIGILAHADDEACALLWEMATASSEKADVRVDAIRALASGSCTQRQVVEGLLEEVQKGKDVYPRFAAVNAVGDLLPRIRNQSLRERSEHAMTDLAVAADPAAQAAQSVLDRVAASDASIANDIADMFLSGRAGGWLPLTALRHVAAARRPQIQRRLREILHSGSLDQDGVARLYIELAGEAGGAEIVDLASDPRDLLHARSAAIVSLKGLAATVAIPTDVVVDRFGAAPDAVRHELFGVMLSIGKPLTTKQLLAWLKAAISDPRWSDQVRFAGYLLADDPEMHLVLRRLNPNASAASVTADVNAGRDVASAVLAAYWRAWTEADGGELQDRLRDRLIELARAGSSIWNEKDLDTLEQYANAAQTKDRTLTQSLSNVVHPYGDLPLALGVGGAGVALALGIVFAVTNPRLRRRLLVKSGIRWQLTVSRCDHLFEVRRDLDSYRVVYRDVSSLVRTAAAAPLAEWPPVQIALHGIRDVLAGTTVLFEVDSELYRRPWSAILQRPWSSDDQATVAGQILSNPADPPPAPTLAEPIFAAIACCLSHDGASVLAGADLEAAAVIRAFKRMGARVAKGSGNVAVASQATVGDLRTALIEADFVHIAAHASPAGIELADGRFGSEEMRRLPTHARSRVVVLSACRTAAQDSDGLSLLHELVRHGITVLGATEPLDDEVCQTFFKHLYEALLEPRFGDGIDLAGAIRHAIKSSRGRFPSSSRQADWRQTVDAFVIFGNPTLRLHVLERSNDEQRTWSWLSVVRRHRSPSRVASNQ